MIYCVGLGPGDVNALPARAHTLLTGVLPTLLRTERHPCIEAGPLAEHFASRGAGNVIPLDDEYESGRTFEETYDAIVERVLRTHATRGDIVYAVPGHPLVGETTVRILLERAADENVAVQIVGAPSFVDACLEAIQAPVVDHLHVVDAHLLRTALPYADPNLGTDGPILLYQVHEQEIASDVKLALLDAGFPDDWPVKVITAAGVPGIERVDALDLVRIDRISVNHLTSIFVPALPREKRPADINTLSEIMARLRDPETGCPWDLKQSHQTLRKYLMEEAYEVAEAIDADDTDALVDELGDVLLQIAFHVQLGRESGMFTLGDIADAICTKMIRRHPHIFADAKADDADAVLANWNAIKAIEKAEKGVASAASALDGISQALPSLSIASEVSKRTVKLGFEWPQAEDLRDKCREELSELLVEWDALIANPTDDNARVRFEAELGDVLFTLVNVARWANLDAETALRRQLVRFGKRWRHIEMQQASAGVVWQDVDAAQFRAWWSEAKIAVDGSA
ncbi:MAG: nucleoside triphosphate pyrophosphohydrolase [Armatimonadota bacterium]